MAGISAVGAVNTSGTARQIHQMELSRERALAMARPA